MSRSSNPFERAFGRDYGEALAMRRRELGISQYELARKIGVSRPMVSRWEKGKCIPNLYHYRLIKDFFRQRKAAA